MATDTDTSAAPATTASTPTAAEPTAAAPTPPSAVEPTAAVAADAAPTTPADAAPATEPFAGNDDSPDILDLAKDPEAVLTEQRQAAAAQFDAYVKAVGLQDGITDIVLQKGENGNPDLTLASRDVGAILSAMHGVGVEPDKAQGMLGIVAALDRVRAEAQSEADADTLRTLRTEARAEFGDALPTAARDMVTGGRALFGADFWNELCAVPALVNDKRFIRALSSYGRTLRSDTGGPAPAPAAASSPSGRLVFDLTSFGRGTRD